MSEVESEVEPPRGHARVVYLGPVAPHWEVQSDFGDRQMIDDFRSRVMARLVLLPPHDPQFRATASGWSAMPSVNTSSSSGTSAIPRTRSPEGRSATRYSW